MWPPLAIFGSFALVSMWLAFRFLFTRPERMSTRTQSRTHYVLLCCSTGMVLLGLYGVFGTAQLDKAVMALAIGTSGMVRSSLELARRRKSDAKSGFYL